MKTMDIYRPADAKYQTICQFAKEVYASELSFTLTKFPEVFFAITEGNNMFGCIGLNTSLHFPPFTNDYRFAQIIRKNGPTVVYAEQSVLALRQCSVGLPLLVSVIAEYCHFAGIHKLAYAAIPVSQKTIIKLGYGTEECCPVDVHSFPPDERKYYARWFEFEPITCLLDTGSCNVPHISKDVFDRLSGRVTIGDRYAKEIKCLSNKAA